MAKILILDDDQGFVDSTTELLKGEGYDVISAGSPSEGKSKVESENPDLIILDVSLEKEEDGLVFAHELADSGDETPIILLTSVTKMATYSYDKAADIQVEAYQDKPIDEGKFKEKVKAIASR
ncbi:MAG: response regulator transcription factor [Spirochaetia bacterium]